jgi:hypothetical protein
MTTILRRAAASTGIDPNFRAVLWISLVGLTLSLSLLNLLGLELTQ